MLQHSVTVFFEKAQHWWASNTNRILTCNDLVRNKNWIFGFRCETHRCDGGYWKLEYIEFEKERAHKVKRFAPIAHSIPTHANPLPKKIWASHKKFIDSASRKSDDITFGLRFLAYNQKSTVVCVFVSHWIRIRIIHTRIRTHIRIMFNVSKTENGSKLVS